MDTGSASDTGSGESLRERDEEIRRILDLQSSIPYKESENIYLYLILITCAAWCQLAHTTSVQEIFNIGYNPKDSNVVEKIYIYFL